MHLCYGVRAERREIFFLPSLLCQGKRARRRGFDALKGRRRRGKRGKRGGRRGKGEGTGYLTSFRVLPLTVRKMYVPAPRAVRAVLRAGMVMTQRPAVS